MKLKSIKELDVTGKTVFIRCDFNVPADEYGNIADDRRIYSTLPTINYCVDHDCKVILASHFGRPKAGVFDEKNSLKPVAKRLHTLLKREIVLAKDVCGADATEKISNMKAGDIVLLENLRFEDGETKNSIEFAKKLAEYADIYINDAFGASHRAHASVDMLPSLFDEDKKSAGFLLLKEVAYLRDALAAPSRPFVAVVGGSKVSGKLEALTSLVTKVDKLIIGGGMAFTFLKAKGYNVGKSLVETELIDEAKKIMQKAHDLGVKIYLPIDITIADKFADDAKVDQCTAQEIP
ncbi:MAG TPA: phosphoglycerate kinase, partial [Campylobacterales bacterium]|nr:phosphoglycerate kinase [Campylobacterales bacterium]